LRFFSFFAKLSFFSFRQKKRKKAVLPGLPVDASGIFVSFWSL
jgi:hypothetical protein